MTIFMRLMDVSVDEKAAALRELVGASGHERVFEREPDAFATVPGSPFAYWASDTIIGTFSRLPMFESDGRIARKGLTTSDDERYVRVWWEPDAIQRESTWSTYAKGGTAHRYWATINAVILWDRKQRTIPGYCGRAGRESSKVECADLMGIAGLTWPLRAATFSPSVLPSNSVFSARGYTIQAPVTDLLWLLALTASTAFDSFFKVCLGRAGYPEFIVGVLQRLPLPIPNPVEQNQLAKLARRAWSLKRSLDTVNETSHAFVLPPGLNEKITGLDPAAIHKELAAIQHEIDNRAFDLYGITAEDRATIETPRAPHPPSPLSNSASLRGEGEEKEETEEEGDEDESSVALGGVALLSWLVGVVFGRFDPRIALGERPVPPEPEPFDPLPSRSPGMRPAEDELPLFPIAVDDPGHDDDLCFHVESAAETIGCIIPEDLRTWLAREFFPLHIKMYSKSRRKAPIYWQLATPSGSYSVWLYLHAFTKDTLYTVQNDYIVPKVEHEERKLEALRREIGDGPKAADRKRLTQQETFVEELHGFVEEIKRIAPMWNPNLDDGVVINFAPLWKLVSHNKPWQKELKTTWDSLIKGDYDWSHLAMHLWPERVVPKCATDRSLAIAHGLEDVFWVEGGDGKWKARAKPNRAVEDIVHERTSAAVKEALQSLLQAGSSSGTVATGRKKRGAK